MRSSAWVLALVGMTVTAGCSKKAVLPEQNMSPHFQRVLSMLDLGGAMFAFVDVEGDLDEFSSVVQDLLSRTSEATADDSWARVNVKALIAELGLGNIAAIGLSSYRDGRIFRNKAFVLLQGERRGLMKVFGGAQRAFELPRLAPHDADFVFERDLNLKAIFDVVARLLKAIDPAEADSILAVLDQPIPDLTVTYRQLIEQLDTRVAAMVRVDADRLVYIPGLADRVPYIDLYLSVERLGMLFDALDRKLKSLPLVKRTEDSRWIQLALANPLPGDLKAYEPLLAKDKQTGRVVLATNGALFSELYSAKKTLAQAPAFQQAMQSLPTKGNGLSYYAPNLFTKLADAVANLVAHDPEAKATLEWLRKALPDEDEPTAAVSANLADGVFFASNSTDSHKTTLIASFYLNPVMIGILAAVAIPAFIEYTRKSKASEVHVELDRCYKAVVERYEQNRTARTKGQPTLPASADIVCPKHAEDISGLNGESSPLDYRQASAQYESLGWTISDPVIACYRYELKAQPGQKSQAAFVCHAWTDVDEDGRPAHWTRVVRWDTRTGTFQSDEVKADDDDY